MHGGLVAVPIRGYRFGDGSVFHGAEAIATVATAPSRGAVRRERFPVRQDDSPFSRITAPRAQAVQDHLPAVPRRDEIRSYSQHSPGHEGDMRRG